jgi:beta-glucosidase
MSFPKDFIWGAATASFQIEGAAHEDGKGLSIWDDFCTQNGKIFDGHNGDIACDHYHRWESDIDLMSNIGLQAYRYSISWPRVMPNGKGIINEKGLDFYDKLTDKLLEKKIEPYITLFHWDLPYELYKCGGFLNPDFPNWFAEYASVIADRLGDRVHNFFTFNEPQCSLGLGYQTGTQAPGHSVSQRSALQILHNILLAHGKGMQALRASAPKPVQAGIVCCSAAHYPSSDKKEDIKAWDMAQSDCVYPGTNDYNAFSIPTWCDPIYLGKYPDKMFKVFGDNMPKIGPNDMKIISEPTDFHGQNVYQGGEIISNKNGDYSFVKNEPGYNRTAFNWAVTPKSLYWTPRFIHEHYHKPIFITENGLSNQDVISLDGKVHDPQRIDFLSRYLHNYKQAGEDGIDIRGYFHWSLMDNFEWAFGYRERFGLIYVDYATQKRLLKDSAYWYKNVITTNGKDI